jgi:hypothetical protein
VGLGNNPVSNVDPLGDIVKSTQEGYDITDDALKRTLGNNHPFKFIKAKVTDEYGYWDYDKSFDPKSAGYTPAQEEVYNRIVGNIDNPRINTVRIVDADEELPPGIVPGNSLKNFGSAAITVNYKYRKGQKIDTYIARLPFKVKKSRDINGKEIEKLRECIPLPLYELGIIALHEIGGHGYNFMKNALIGEGDDITLTENFEELFKEKYELRKYTKFEEYWYEFWSIFGGEKHPAGSPVYLGGKAIKHERP